MNRQMLQHAIKSKMKLGLIAVEKIKKKKKILKNVLLKKMYVIQRRLQWNKCLNAD